MSFADFLLSSTQDASPPEKLRPALAALWYDRRGNWERAHDWAQQTSGKDGAWVHAYLHRKEGDETNAAYWYRLAGRPISPSGLDKEWEEIALTLWNEKAG